MTWLHSRIVPSPPVPTLVRDYLAIVGFLYLLVSLLKVVLPKM